MGKWRLDTGQSLVPLPPQRITFIILSPYYVASAAPDLPTELGSVIANVDTLFGHYDWAMLADPGDNAGVSWVVASADGYKWVRPDEITSWTPCTVEVQS